jgi:hypothetical protein
MILIADFEVPAVVSGLGDVAVIVRAVEQRGATTIPARRTAVRIVLHHELRSA